MKPNIATKTCGFGVLAAKEQMKQDRQTQVADALEQCLFLYMTQLEAIPQHGNYSWLEVAS